MCGVIVAFFLEGGTCVNHATSCNTGPRASRSGGKNINFMAWDAMGKNGIVLFKKGGETQFTNLRAKRNFGNM